MIKINLLPFRAARKKEDVRRQLSIYVLTVIMFVLGMVYFFINLNGKLAELAGREELLSEQMAGYADINSQMKETRGRIDELRSRLAVIRALEKGKTGPVLLFEEVARAVPKDRLWVRTLAEKDGILTIEGSAMDNDTVALFMTELEKADYIRSVDLVNTRMKHLSQYGLNVSDFVLQCRTYSFREPEPQNEQKNGRPRRARR